MDTKPRLTPSVSRILDIVPRSLLQTYLQLVPLRKPLAKELPDDKTNVLNSRSHLPELGNLLVQIAVVKLILDLRPDHLLKVFEIDQDAGDRIGFSGDFHFQLIVVTMVMWIGTLAKYLEIFLIAPGRYIQPVGCIEMPSAKQGNTHKND